MTRQLMTQSGKLCTYMHRELLWVYEELRAKLASTNRN